MQVPMCAKFIHGMIIQATSAKLIPKERNSEADLITVICTINQWAKDALKLFHVH